MVFVPYNIFFTLTFELGESFKLPFSAVGPSYRCDNHTEFDCKTNYRCVPLWTVCNGHDDCRDNSDEQGCGA